MKTEEDGRKIWETPEVFDLDVKETKGGVFDLDTEDGTYHVVS